MLKKLKYGLSRFKSELIGKTDYWHTTMNSRNYSLHGEIDKYYVDISEKGKYPFKTQNNIPIVKINEQDLILPVTVLNYGLGLIDLFSDNNTDLSYKIKSVSNWLIENQTQNGFWSTPIKDATYNLSENWLSGMVQGLAISFFIRGTYHKILSYDEIKNSLDLALKTMLSDKIVNHSVNGEIIEEYGGTKTNVLNGFIFAIYGLADYGKFTGDFSFFHRFEKSLYNILPVYDYYSWSYYDSKKLIASRFYHELHIEMLRSMYFFTRKEKYNEYYRKWEKAKTLSFIFILSKAIQKIAGLKKIDTLEN
jgi:hypothetical protein